jgi:hypothetical protein
MFTRHFSFFAALLISAPAGAKQGVDRPADTADVETRILRAKAIIEKLDQPQDYGGVTRDDADPNKLSWINFSNFTNFSNFRNFQNFQNFHNFQNFRNFTNFQNFQNFHNAPQVRQPVVPPPPAPRHPTAVEPPRIPPPEPGRPVPNPPAPNVDVRPWHPPGSGSPAHPQQHPLSDLVSPPEGGTPPPGPAGQMAHPDPRPSLLLEHPPRTPGEPPPVIAGPASHADPRPFRPVAPHPVHLPPRIPHHEPRPFPVLTGEFVRLPLPVYPVVAILDPDLTAAIGDPSDPLADLYSGLDQTEAWTPDTPADATTAVPMDAGPSGPAQQAAAAATPPAPRPPSSPPGADMAAGDGGPGPATARTPADPAQLKEERDITAYVDTAISRYQRESEHFVDAVRNARDGFRKLDKDDAFTAQNSQPLLQNFGYAAVCGAGAPEDAAAPANGDTAEAYWQILRHSMETAPAFTAVLARFEEFTDDISGDARPKLDRLLAVFRRFEK